MLKLREELIRAKTAADEERLQREKYEEKLKDLEKKLNDICSTGMVGEVSFKQNNLDHVNKKVPQKIIKINAHIVTSLETLGSLHYSFSESPNFIVVWNHSFFYFKVSMHESQLRKRMTFFQFFTPFPRTSRAENPSQSV